MTDASQDIIVKLTVEVRLTEAELKAASKEMAEALNRKTQIEGSLEAFKAQKKAEVSAQDAVISRCANLVNSEKEFRLIECKVVYDFGKKGLKTFYRLDNGEAVRSEPISNEERQRMIPLGVVSPKDGKSKGAGE